MHQALAALSPLRFARPLGPPALGALAGLAGCPRPKVADSNPTDSATHDTDSIDAHDSVPDTEETGTGGTEPPAGWQSGSVAELAAWELSGIEPSDRLGYDVRLLPDATGEGAAEVVVSAPGASAVFYFANEGTGLPETTALATGAWLREGIEAGVSLAIGDLVVGDLRDEIVVGTAWDGARIVRPIEGTLSLDDPSVIRVGGSGTGAGSPVAVADTDGDTLAELLLGAVHDDAAGKDTGRVWLVQPEGWDSSGDLVTDPAVTSIEGIGPADLAGTVTSIGDLDADGQADLAIGAAGVAEGAGAVYVFHSDPATRSAKGVVSLADADVAIGAVAPGGGLALGVGGGDATGSGYATVALAAPDAWGAGEIYAIDAAALGSAMEAGAFPIRVQSTDPGAALGGGVRAVVLADLDRDGTDDLVVGAPWASPEADAGGAVYAFWGPLSGVYDTADADVTVTGDADGDTLGAVIEAGDVDGDGGVDLLVGAPQLGGSAPGHLYLLTEG